MIPLTPIGIIHSPYKEKFAIPRQPGQVTAAQAWLELLPPFNHPDCVRELESFSHLWLIFQFHATVAQGWQPLVRPPRLGGNRKVGVFASRSTFRPNGLGQSVVSLQQIDVRAGGVWLALGGIDLLDGTPVIDIKPYLPYADAIPEARGGYAPEPPLAMPVQFEPAAQITVASWSERWPGLETLIVEVLAQDPRPGYRHALRDDERHYGVRLYDVNVRWQVRDGVCRVTGLSRVEDDDEHA